jgi:hypothetical protein
VRRALSRRAHRHYRGFAASQLREYERGPTAKRALYVLRTALTGAHLLAAGEIVTDVHVHLEPRGFAGVAAELLEIKRSSERAALAAPMVERCTRELLRALEVLDQAERASPLPPAAPPEAERDLEEWMIERRRAEWG